MKFESPRMPDTEAMKKTMLNLALALGTPFTSGCMYQNPSGVLERLPAQTLHVEPHHAPTPELHLTREAAMKEKVVHKKLSGTIPNAAYEVVLTTNGELAVALTSQLHAEEAKKHCLDVMVYEDDPHREKKILHLLSEASKEIAYLFTPSKTVPTYVVLSSGDVLKPTPKGDENIYLGGIISCLPSGVGEFCGLKGNDAWLSDIGTKVGAHGVTIRYEPEDSSMSVEKNLE